MSATPTIYFIDDSATMREVIKIAFRRENISVVACHDAALALVEIEKTKPDIVITDVIMPDKDGYDVCQFIKSHPELAKIPVVLMSGVVNRAVAEKAFAVKADELLRKPFQPQDLIARVKHLLNPNGTPKPTPAAAATAAAALSSIFTSASPTRPAAPAPPSQRPVGLIETLSAAAAPSSPATPTPARGGLAPTPAPAPAQPAQSAGANAPAPGVQTPPAASAQSPAPAAVQTQTPVFAGVQSPAAPAAQAPSPVQPPSTPGTLAPTPANGSTPVVAPSPAVSPTPASVAVGPAKPVTPGATNNATPSAAPANGNEVAKLKIEILRLEGLVRKLQSELQAEREYARSLEVHVKSLQEAER